MALKKLCPKCSTLIAYTDKYCIKHIDADKQRHTQYKRYRTDQTEQSFYTCKEWRIVREVVIARDHGLCQICLGDKKITLFDAVHHKTPIKTDFNKRLDVDNCICLCDSCHKLEHVKLDNG